MNWRENRGEVHPYILAAGITVVLVTLFLVLSEMVMVNAAIYYTTQAVKASLRGAARMQDFQKGGELLRGPAYERFAALLASNLNLALTDQDANTTITLQPQGTHPYIGGTTTADFWILEASAQQEQAVVTRVRAPLRLPFIGPYYQALYGRPPSICLSLAVTPHDQYGGTDLEPARIPVPCRCP